MNEENSRLELINKFRNPISISGILLFVFYGLVLLLFFLISIYKVTQTEENSFTKYFWNSYFESRDLTENTIIDSGFVEEFPLAASWVIISGLILLLIISLFLFFGPILLPELTRIRFITWILWPSFIGNTMILASSVTFIGWISQQRTEESVILLGFPVLSVLIISTIILLLILLLVAFISRIYNNEQRISRMEEKEE